MIGRANKQEGQAIFVSLRSKNKEGEKVKPFFTFSKKIDGAYAVFHEDTEFSGDLRKVAVVEREFKLPNGKTEVKKEVSIQLFDADADESYILRVPLRISTRSLLNRVLNLKDPKNISVSVWEDDKGYEVLSLRQNGEMVKQKYTKEEVPPAPKVKVNGTEVSDTFALNEFYLDKVAEFGKNLKDLGKEEVDSDEDAGPADLHDDEVPF